MLSTFSFQMKSISQRYFSLRRVKFHSLKTKYVLGHSILYCNNHINMRFSIEYSNPSACPTDIWAILMHFYIYTYLKLSQNYGVFNGLVWQAIFRFSKHGKLLVFIKAYNFLENIAFYKKSNFMSCPIF